MAEATRNAAAAGVSDRASFELQDALAVDLSPATVVMLYLVEWSTRMLDAKLAAELRPGARIVSHSFGMGDRPAEKTEQWVDATGEAADAAAVDRRQGRHRTGRRERRRLSPGRRSGPLEVAELADLADLTAGRASRRSSAPPFRSRSPPPGTSGWSSPRSLPLSPQTSFTGAFRAPFRLIFHGPAQPVHPQATLPLEHPAARTGRDLPGSDRPGRAGHEHHAIRSDFHLTRRGR